MERRAQSIQAALRQTQSDNHYDWLGWAVIVQRLRATCVQHHSFRIQTPQFNLQKMTLPFWRICRHLSLQSSTTNSFLQFHNTNTGCLEAHRQYLSNKLSLAKFDPKLSTKLQEKRILGKFFLAVCAASVLPYFWCKSSIPCWEFITLNQKAYYSLLEAHFQ